MNDGQKDKMVSFPLLGTGQFLVIVNIFANAFTPKLWNVAWIDYLALVLLFFALILWPFPFFALRKHGNINSNGSFLATTQLVDRGVYAIVRHPQYLAMILLNVALLLLDQNWITAVISILSSFMLVKGSREEEKNLIDQFGEQYCDYCQKVPAFNPFGKLFLKKFKR